MNFKEYKLWQKEFLEKKPNVFRADCMNPFKSMDYLLKNIEFSDKKREKKELYELWSKVNSIEISTENLAFSKGVRDSLGILFEIFKEKNIYMPQDIYPRYFELASKNKVHTFTTYPMMDWAYIGGIKGSVVLLTIPFTPVGRRLSDEDIGQIEELISNGNYVVIDSVYDYDLKKSFSSLGKLLKSERLFWLHSLSKTYLSPEVLGINYVPSGYKQYFESSWKAKKKDGADFSRPYDILAQKQNFAEVQAGEFRKGWSNLYENTGLEVSAEIAYFSVIEEPFEELLKRNILGVPASVFGSKKSDVTIVTSLFYLSVL